MVNKIYKGLQISLSECYTTFEISFIIYIFINKRLGLHKA